MSVVFPSIDQLKKATGNLVSLAESALLLADEIYNDRDAMTDLLGDRLFDEMRRGGFDPLNDDLWNLFVDYLADNGMGHVSGFAAKLKRKEPS
jgi:hypothetical protein